MAISSRFQQDGRKQLATIALVLNRVAKKQGAWASCNTVCSLSLLTEMTFRRHNNRVLKANNEATTQKSNYCSSLNPGCWVAASRDHRLVARK